MEYFFTTVQSPGIQVSFLHMCKVIIFRLVHSPCVLWHRGIQQQNAVMTADQDMIRLLWYEVA
jgi:hypothetical protein